MCSSVSDLLRICFFIVRSHFFYILSLFFSIYRPLSCHIITLYYYYLYFEFPLDFLIHTHFCPYTIDIHLHPFFFTLTQPTHFHTHSVPRLSTPYLYLFNCLFFTQPFRTGRPYELLSFNSV